MVPGPGGSLVPALSIDDLLNAVPEIRGLADWSAVQVANKDSTDIDASDWMKLIAVIQERYGEFDGFLVAHGTDTMAESGGALSLAFGTQLTKPIILTGSQLPLLALRADARQNLVGGALATVAFAHRGYAEVGIAFDNDVFRACRTKKINDKEFDAFISPALPALAHFDADGIRLNLELLRTAPSFRPPSIRALSDFDENIVAIKLHTGPNPNLYLPMLQNEESLPSGMILVTKGSGNVPHKFRPVLERANNLEVPVMLVSPFNAGTVQADKYDAGAWALELGALTSGDMTDEMAIVKMQWLLGMGIRDRGQLQEYLLADYMGEVSARSNRYVDLKSLGGGDATPTPANVLA